MKTIYKSKVGLEIVGLMVLVLLFTFYQLYAISALLIGMLFILPIFGFIAYVLWSIHYVIEKDVLIIKALFYDSRIDIQDIRTVSDSKNPISSPAASLDRLKISYADHYVLISPKEKEEFIKHLQDINSDVNYAVR